MKNKLLNKLWLRVGMIVAVMTIALSSTAWGQPTYKLEQVTSVEAGGLYVFEQGGYVMINTCESSALQTTNTYNTTGLTGTETYVWTLEAATNGYYMKNPSITGSSPYLKNGSSTSVTFGTKTSSDNIWRFSFTDGEALIQVVANNRFLGWTTKTSHVYKAYDTSNLSSYPHAIKVYQLVEEGGTPEYESVSVGDLKYSTYASDNALDFTGSCIKAFYPTIDGATLIFHEITRVPAGTGVLLYSANGAVTEDILVCTDETDAVENNVFVRGTGERVSYNDTTQDYIYVLSKPQGDNLGFYKANNNMVAANRAYIRVPAELSGAKSFTVNLEDDLTGIIDLNANLNLHEGIYNLAGQRLQKMQKGINIINGKKVLK